MQSQKHASSVVLRLETMIPIILISLAGSAISSGHPNIPLRYMHVDTVHQHQGMSAHYRRQSWARQPSLPSSSSQRSARGFLYPIAGVCVLLSMQTGKTESKLADGSQLVQDNMYGCTGLVIGISGNTDQMELST